MTFDRVQPTAEAISPDSGLTLVDGGWGPSSAM
jgi:hypothetical protein